MASRRARMKDTTPEATPEPEPKPAEPVPEVEPKPEIKSPEDETKSSYPNEKSRCPEKIIERIIICPGRQNIQCCCNVPAKQHRRSSSGSREPRVSAEGCEEHEDRQPKRKSQKKKNIKNSCTPYTIPDECKPKKTMRNKATCTNSCELLPCPAPIIFYQQPVSCCCPSSDSEEEPEDEDLGDPATFASLANMVFAAVNVMSEYPNAF